MNLSDAVHRPAGRDDVAHARRRARRHRWRSSQLPVSPLPQVDYPTISCQAALPGASPRRWRPPSRRRSSERSAASPASTEMTSSSSLGSTRVTLQFDLDRDIDGAARDVQAAINAARNTLPTGLPSNPTYRKVNPADAPVHDHRAHVRDDDAGRRCTTRHRRSSRRSCRRSRASGQVQRRRQLAAGGARRGQSVGAQQVRHRLRGRCATPSCRPTPTVRRARSRTTSRHWQIGANDQARSRVPSTADDRRVAKDGASVRLSDVADVVDSVQDLRNAGSADGRPSVLLIINRQPGANIIETVDRVRALLPQLQASIPAAIDLQDRAGSHADDPRVAARGGARARHLVRARDPRRVRCSCAT